MQIECNAENSCGSFLHYFQIALSSRNAAAAATNLDFLHTVLEVKQTNTNTNYLTHMTNGLHAHSHMK